MIRPGRFRFKKRGLYTKLPLFHMSMKTLKTFARRKLLKIKLHLFREVALMRIRREQFLKEAVMRLYAPWRIKDKSYTERFLYFIFTKTRYKKWKEDFIDFMYFFNFYRHMSDIFATYTYQNYVGAEQAGLFPFSDEGWAYEEEILKIYENIYHPYHDEDDFDEEDEEVDTDVCYHLDQINFDTEEHIKPHIPKLEEWNGKIFSRIFPYNAFMMFTMKRRMRQEGTKIIYFEEGYVVNQIGMEYIIYKPEEFKIKNTMFARKLMNYYNNVNKEIYNLYMIKPGYETINEHHFNVRQVKWQVLDYIVLPYLFSFTKYYKPVKAFILYYKYHMMAPFYKLIGYFIYLGTVISTIGFNLSLLTAGDVYFLALNSKLYDILNPIVNGYINFLQKWMNKLEYVMIIKVNIFNLLDTINIVGLFDIFF